MNKLISSARALSPISSLTAAAHRRMALAALRADSSVSVRLARYNAHMIKARAIGSAA